MQQINMIWNVTIIDFPHLKFTSYILPRRQVDVLELDV